MLDERRLAILADAAKYDVSCSSSGSKRQNNGADLVTPVLVEYATRLHKTGGVYRYLKYL